MTPKQYVVFEIYDPPTWDVTRHVPVREVARGELAAVILGLCVEASRAEKGEAEVSRGDR